MSNRPRRREHERAVVPCLHKVRYKGDAKTLSSLFQRFHMRPVMQHCDEQAGRVLHLRRSARAKIAPRSTHQKRYPTRARWRAGHLESADRMKPGRKSLRARPTNMQTTTSAKRKLLKYRVYCRRRSTGGRSLDPQTLGSTARSGLISKFYLDAVLLQRAAGSGCRWPAAWSGPQITSPDGKVP
jgi:hypothetical protein